jgi:hypothetical protein
MANVSNLDDYRKSPSDPSSAAGLKGGGGDGTFDGMEPRVAALEKRFDRLEAQLDKLTEKVADLRVDMGVVRERISHLPTKGWAVGISITTIGLISAIVTLAPKLQQLLGIIPK